MTRARRYPASSALGLALRMAWRSHRAAFVAGLLTTLFAGIAPVAAAWLLRSILDTLAYGSRHAALPLLVLALACAGGAQAVLPNVGRYASAQSGRAIQRQATATLFAAVGHLNGLRRLEDPAYRDTLNMAQQAGQSGPGLIVSSLSSIVQGAVTLSGFFAVLLVLNPAMAVILLAATIPEVFVELRLARKRAAIMRGMSHAERRQAFYADLLSNYAAAAEIRLFRLAPFFQRRILEELTAIQQAGQSVDRRALAGYSALDGLSAIIAGCGIWWAVYAAAGGRLTIGDVAIFAAAMMAVTSSLSQIISSAALAYQALLLFRCYQEVVTEKPDLPSPARPAVIRPLRQGIALSDVWFRYGPDKPWAIRGLSLFIPQGQTIALVGVNGAGKSTLIKLLCRFYDPERGQVQWDGTDLRDFKVTGLRDSISVVFQDFARYEMSVSDNIAVGALDKADSRSVQAAAAQAGIHDAITALPDGYDTLLTCSYFDLTDKLDPKTGVLLSGGQWQRLALARALLRGSRDLMILDEPSSGLDAQAEHEIHHQLRACSGNSTTILITHRLSAARSADRIVVLADGQVAEEGSHDALMASCGTYARMFSLQARGFADDQATVTPVAQAQATVPGFQYSGWSGV
jgi:ATP-binding cassette subfamily B protein